MILGNASETEAFGAFLGALLRPGDIIALTGDLGAGKTTLARGLLRGLGHAGEVPSPSFAIVQPYEHLVPPVAHVDLYRLEEDAELAELGLEDWLWDGALIVEWPQRLGPALLSRSLSIALSVGEDGARVLTATVPEAWTGRWPPR